MNRYRYFLARTPKLLRLRLAGDVPGLEGALFDMFTEMGGIYVKFLQIIISNARGMQTIPAAKRMSVFSQVTPSEMSHELVLKEEVGEKAFSQFAYIADQPFAAGSFANVYKARLQSGEDVVIKIKRPGLDKQLSQDVRVLKLAVGFLSALPSAAMRDIKSIASEYVAGIRREVDYKSEVRCALRFYESYTNSSSILIPRTYPDLSTKSVIVQEYIDGVELSEILESDNPHQSCLDKTGSNLEAVLRIVGMDILSRSFNGDFVHGDPHPGNLLILSNNQVGLIDFGLVAESAKDVLGYYEYMKEQTYINRGQLRPGKFALLLMRTSSQSLFYALHFLDVKFTNIEILKGIETAADSRFYQRAKDPDAVVSRMQQGNTTEIFDSVINPGNQLQFDTDFDGLMMRRAHHTVWSTIIGLGLYRKMIPSMYEEAVSIAQQRNEIQKFKGGPQDVDVALEIVGDWLQSVRESDPLFFMSVKQLFPASLWSD